MPVLLLTGGSLQTDDRGCRQAISPNCSVLMNRITCPLGSPGEKLTLPPMVRFLRPPVAEKGI
jgi:hypothetical protein